LKRVATFALLVLLIGGAPAQQTANALAPRSTADASLSESFDRAFQSGDKMVWFHKAAEKANPRALDNLGLIYNWGPLQDGQSVAENGWEFYGQPRDYARAAQWFRKSAQQGDTFAQRQLGEMYSAGLGFPRDFVSAYMWFNVAATKSDSDSVIARRSRDQLEKQMTPGQIAEAQRLSREWRPPR
jgi:hypothetical protein